MKMIKSAQLKIFLTNTITATIIAIVIAEVEDYDNVQVDIRPIPPDLYTANNKTEYERAMEECMGEYVTCLSTLSKFSKHDKICAESKELGRKVFNNRCDMMYESCKAGNLTWHFVKDDDGTCVKS